MAEASKGPGPGGKVTITAIKARNLEKLGHWALNDVFHVKLMLDDQTLRTTKRIRCRRPNVSWNQPFELSFVGPMPELLLEVHGQSSPISKAQFIGRAKIDLHTAGALETGLPKLYNCRLENGNVTNAGEVDIWATITLFSNQNVAAEKTPKTSPTGAHDSTPGVGQVTSGADESVPSVPAQLTPIASNSTPRPSDPNRDSRPTLLDTEAAGGVEPAHHPIDLPDLGSEVAPLVARAVGDASDLRSPNLPDLPQHAGVDGDTLAPAGNLVASLLDGMNAFANLIDIVSEIHPYAKAAWSILNFGRQIIISQIQQDNDLRDLAQYMDSLYKRVRRVVAGVEGSLSDVCKRHQDIMLCIARQANECAYFIVDYCKDDKFVKRTIKHTFINQAQRKIKQYQSAFAALEKAFEDDVQDSTEMVLTLVWQDLRDLKTTLLLDKLKTC